MNYNFNAQEIYQKHVVDKISLNILAKEYGCKLRALKEFCKRHDIAITVYCSICNTTDNLKTEHNGKIHSICYDCYALERKKLWNNKTQIEKDEINKKVSEGVVEAFKNDPSIVERQKQSNKIFLESLKKEGKIEDYYLEKQKHFVLTCNEKYGVDNVFQLESVKEKSKNTRFKKYGDPNFRNVNKSMDTKENKYGDRNYNNMEAQISTMLNRYGVTCAFYSDDILNRIKETRFKKYGDPYYVNREKGMSTCIERYGVANPLILNSYSKISQEFCWGVYNKLPKVLQETCYFAELNREFGKYDNNKKCYYYYDFVVLSKNIVVEFNGDIFHANPTLYKENDCPNPFFKTKTSKQIWEYDNIKNNLIKNMGFTVYIVWESDYITNKEKTINNIVGKIL